MRWIMVAVLVVLWFLGWYEGAGPYIHLVLLAALFLGLVFLLAGRPVS